MQGLIYRMGIAIKDFGERNKCHWLAKLGLRLKDKGVIKWKN